MAWASNHTVIPPSFLHLLEKLRHRRLIQSLIIRIHIQPSVKVFFRPEEIIHRSPTSPLNPNCFGSKVGNLTGGDLDGNGIAAMSTGIFNFDGFIGLAGAVDQQQVVHCSPYIEDRLALPVNGVEIMPQGSPPGFCALS